MRGLLLSSGFALALMAAGCGTDTCPAGSTMVGERCIASDAGVGGDADMATAGDMSSSRDMTIGPDGEVTCAPACSGALPHCVGGECKECLDTSECPDRSPLCNNNTCEPCSAGTCDAEQSLRELGARSCEQLTRFLGTSTFLSFRAQICASHALTDLPYYKNRLAAAEAGRVRFLAEEFETCTASHLRLEESCPDFEGLVPAAGVCYDDVECTSGRCGGETCPGACEPEVAEHGICGSDANCMPGFSCIALHCEAGGHIGDPCVSGGCAEGDCDTDTDTCVPFLVAGDECGSPSGYCTSDLFCDPTNSRCRAFAGMGQPCDMTYLGPQCSPGNVCVSGTCTTAIEDGDACTAGPTASCELGTTCVGGHCERIRTNNEACDPAPCAAGLRCSSGRCAALPSLGSACTVTEGCLRGTCIGGLCASLEPDDACVASDIRDADAMDACGEGSTCISAGGAPRCIVDADAAEACGTSVAQCAAPNECDDDECSAPCVAPASP